MGDAAARQYACADLRQIEQDAGDRFGQAFGLDRPVEVGA
jgi:hypothetical protein